MERQKGSRSCRGDDELMDEKKLVYQQEITPGRRGEKIKHEELDMEFVRQSKAKLDRP
jgi:hypothetical protein